MNKARSREYLWLILLGAIMFMVMAWLSVARYRGYNMEAFDLGNMSQSIWSVTQGKPLVFTTEGIEWSRLAFHVEIFYFLLAPFYKLWPSPAGLLIIQAAFYAAGAWPLYRLARRRWQHPPTAFAITAIYLFYPVAQTAVLFHFHADTLAMPILLAALEALDRKAWKSYAFWLILALSCKFYVAAPVSALGVALWWQGERRAGTATFSLGVAWGLVAFLLIRPLFAPAEVVQSAATAGGYINYYFGQLSQFWETISYRAVTGLIVGSPLILLIWQAPSWLLPAAAVMLPTLLSNGPGPSYDYRYHHYALAVPFLLAAAVAGAAAMRRDEGETNQRPVWQRRVYLSLLLTLVFSALLVDTPLNPLFYATADTSGRGLSETGYLRSPRDTLKDEWLQTIDRHAPLIAGDSLGLRLINRAVYYRTDPQFKPLAELLPEVEYIVIDALNDYVTGTPDEIVSGGVAAQHDLLRRLVAGGEFQLLQAQDGLLLFGRQAAGRVQVYALTTRSVPAPSPTQHMASFNDAIGLVKAEIVPSSSNRFRLDFEWQALRPLAGDPPYLAVSRLGDVPHSRLVHLPTLALRPPATWEPDQIIQESFEFVLPADTPPGRYPLYVGWYDSENIYAPWTDERSRLGEEVQLGWLMIP